MISAPIVKKNHGETNLQQDELLKARPSRSMRQRQHVQRKSDRAKQCQQISKAFFSARGEQRRPRRILRQRQQCHSQQRHHRAGPRRPFRRIVPGGRIPGMRRQDGYDHHHQRGNECGIGRRRVHQALRLEDIPQRQAGPCGRSKYPCFAGSAGEILCGRSTQADKGNHHADRVKPLRRR